MKSRRSGRDMLLQPEYVIGLRDADSFGFERADRVRHLQVAVRPSRRAAAASRPWAPTQAPFHVRRRRCILRATA
jgi:hypothetical protein